MIKPIQHLYYIRKHTLILPPGAYWYEIRSLIPNGKKILY
ncbi:MAG: hypothetical protein H6Q26_1040, partial [Bacteroidetes bacterium]|nr:hypothetical protein [Bacteroidota bacterium]